MCVSFLSQQLAEQSLMGAVYILSGHRIEYPFNNRKSAQKMKKIT